LGLDNGEKRKKGKYVWLLLLFLLLALVPVFFMYAIGVPLPQGEDTSPRIFVSDVSADAGGEVYVSVGLAYNPGFAGIVLDLAYDEKALQPLEVLQGGLVSGAGLFDSHFAGGVVKAAWFDAEDMAGDGEIFAVKFRALPGGKGKASPITLSYDKGNIANILYEDVDFNVVSANVTIR
jgi:hypothetical protein